LSQRYESLEKTFKELDRAKYSKHTKSYKKFLMDILTEDSA